MIIILFYPEIGWFFVLWALLIGWARIALEIHYIVDIDGGIVIGRLVGLGGYFLINLFDKLVSPLLEWFPTI
ncbi:MAG: phosphatase PAP2 family protein [Candidatus Heimdallarchaeaceae archaeon]